jgi:enoyl-CoA hydratase/carnithine racemase
MAQRRLSNLLSSCSRFRAAPRLHQPCRSWSASPDEPSSSSEPIVTTTFKSNGIAHVQLNRPKKMNALDLAMFEAIAETAERLAKDKSVRAVILSGQGRAFCTGLDVKSIATKTNPLTSIKKLLSKRYPDDQTAVSNLAQDVGYLWRAVPAPVIAAIHGMCYGGGLQIALGADMRFCTLDCKLSIMEAKWGLIPDMSGSVTLRELLPIDVAKELTFTGRIISGEEAAKLNLVTRCVQDPLQEAEKVALEIVQKSPDAVAAAKKLFQKNWVSQSEADALNYEMELQKTLLGSWNQIAASADNFGVSVPYLSRKEGQK